MDARRRGTPSGSVLAVTVSMVGAGKAKASVLRTTTVFGPTLISTETSMGDFPERCAGSLHDSLLAEAEMASQEYRLGEWAGPNTTLDTPEKKPVISR